MKKLKFLNIFALLALLLLIPLLGTAPADDNIWGSIRTSIGLVDGERESSKFLEYRDIPDGLTGSVELQYRMDKYFINLKARDIGEEDQYYNFKSGAYGKYKLELGFDQAPHRFAYDAKSVFSGIGSGVLTVPDGMQNDLQTNTTSTTDLATRLKRDYFPSAHSVDMGLTRDRSLFRFDILAFNPFKVRLETKWENRQGTRPLFASFGFGNPIEVAEPIDYDTLEFKVIGEYTGKPVYLSGTYYASAFRNNIDILAWDNPFRSTDSTTATAYSSSYQAGPRRGLIDLYPDNDYQSFTLTGALRNLPRNTTISATTSWGFQKQNDAFEALTTNTAITTGAANSPPYDASDKANLPKQSIDAQVDTQLYNVILTTKLLDFLHVKGSFRYYAFENDTETLEFPGWVRFDAVWEALPGGVTIENEPLSFRKTNAGVDFSLDVLKNTTLILGYAFESMHRKHAEVEESDENSLKVSLDTRPIQKANLRLSYKRSDRNADEYDFTVPFEREILAGEDPPQLPFLRKYNQADRVRDDLQFLVTLFPTEKLTLTASYIFGRDDFDNSYFGLLNDKHNFFSLDVDFAPNERVNLYVFYALEKYNSRQRSRQWTPGGVGDPYVTDTTVNSPQNFNVTHDDEVNTVGGGLTVALIPQKVKADLSYSFAGADVEERLSGPLADTGNRIPFLQVDDSSTQTLNAKLKYRLRKNLTLGLNYMYERFEINDFNNIGFTNVPTTTTGAYNPALLMGTLWKDYNVNAVYASVAYKF